ncbi:hypothetical protein [Tautonia plasticadhaerens]|uniref:Uncharacterized protein n=1 Tax=Tautonia plasticadhaerens TaxID=2527974 RepID=A0A518H9B6_9BACT|nr:hypothetical protein [Tautonia plasticadhaerens]QDV37439.1 hypothetical protein ElP_53780 [Tautonia plasticadhaerens]
MRAKIVDRRGSTRIVQFEFDVGTGSGSLLDDEEAILRALNEAGVVATEEALKRFDTSGEPMERGGVNYTSKGRVLKIFECPYGKIPLERHIYQNSAGGSIICPLDERAAIILSSTPRFAKMISSKYADFGASKTQDDMEKNHARIFSRGMALRLSEVVASIALASDPKQGYKLPDVDATVKTILVTIGSAEMAPPGRGTPRAALGTIGMYDINNELRFSCYFAGIVGPGPDSFVEQVHRELGRIRTAFPMTRFVGVSGGEDWSTEFLARHVDSQFVDPDSVIDDLARASAADLPEDEAQQRSEWLSGLRERFHQDQSVFDDILGRLGRWESKATTSSGKETILQIRQRMHEHVTHGRLNYSQKDASMLLEFPGSTADLARTLLGDRFRQARNKLGVSQSVALLTLRALTRNFGRWQEFWDGIVGRLRLASEDGRSTKRHEGEVACGDDCKEANSTQKRKVPGKQTAKRSRGNKQLD